MSDRVFLVDERIGSKDLLGPLQRLGVPAELAHLQYADCAFIGRGIGDADCSIGIELKETRDLVTCLQSARFSGHQLPGLLQTYDRVWLLTEGIWRASADGALEVLGGGWKTLRVGRRALMLRDVESWILTQVIRGGIWHWHAGTRADTVRFLATLYHWWTAKVLEEHRSHQAIYRPPPDRASFVEPSTFLKVVTAIPGVGWDKALALDAACGGSLHTLVHADVKSLEAVPGIGLILAARIHQTWAGPPGGGNHGTHRTSRRSRDTR